MGVAARSEGDAMGGLKPEVDAAEVGLLALTHLSPRYSGAEVRDEARAVFERTIVPQDFDRVELPFPERGGPVHVRAS